MAGKWKRDALLIPLIVGLLVAFFTYALPKLLDKGKELSYTIDGPTSYINQQAAGNVTLVVDGISTSHLYAYRAKIWNSGGTPLKDLAVRFSFAPKQQAFQIFNVSHDTNPKIEFGKIEENGSDASSKRFVYELLNPGDEDIVTFLINDDGPLSLNAKAEGLKVSQILPKEPTKWPAILGLISFLFAFGTSLASLGLKYITEKAKFWPFK